MKVFYCVNHDGHYIGGCSMILADSFEQAQELLDEALKRKGLKPFAEKPYMISELINSRPIAVVLFDGDY